MAVNSNKVISGGKADGLTKRLTTARTSTATIASPADAADLRELFTAGPNGGFTDEIGYNFVGTGTQAASLIYIWRTNSSGANAEIVYRFIIAAQSAMSNTVPGARDILQPIYENMAAGEKLFASISVLSSNCELVIWARSGQFEAQ